MDAGERPRRQPARQRQPAATAALQRQPLPRGKAWISVTPLGPILVLPFLQHFIGIWQRCSNL